MNSNDEHVDSDEHDEEEEEEEQPIDDNDVESEVEQAEDDDDSNQHVVEGNTTPANDEEEVEEEEEEGVDQEEEEEEEEETKTRDTVDPTNPLDEDSVEAAQNLTQEDVFGEELSDLSEDEDGVRRQKSHDDLNGTPHDDEHELIDEQEEEEQIIVDAPHVTCDLGRDIHLVKLPSFMKVEPKPFDPQYFNEEIRDEDDEDSKARIKLQLENSIRWRYATNDAGEMVRESNTRLVRWSDGSLSLHVGKEIFDVSKANIQSDHNHLFVRHQKSMQAQAVFRTKLSFRQHSNDSLAHLKLKFASKANPAPKVRVLSNIKAPMINSADMMKKEEQRAKAEERRRNQQLRQRERAAYRDRNMSASYLEDRDDEEDNEQESISTIKKNARKKKLHGGYRDEETSEEEEDDDNPKEKFIGQKSTASTKHRKVASSDDEDNDQEQSTKRKRVESDGGGGGDEEEEEEEEEAEDEEEQESD